MPQDNFSQRKKDILSKLDKSSIGSWDKKIKVLCDKINSNKNFYTTSSCSGRIVLIVEQEKKAEGLFLKVWHDLISFEELKNSLLEISENKYDTLRVYAQKGHKNLRAGPEKFSKKIFTRGTKFKQEPMILHVACNSLEDAKEIMKIAQDSGFKKVGIISLGKNIVVEINGTEKMEFPIFDKDILVDDIFLKLIVKESNSRMERNWLKIKKFENNF
jgi:tRNA wybutosine-synthesizing protein 3